jgi:4-carboxymuconolactone decarboxylase
MARLPEITDRNELDEKDREFYDYIVKTRGAVRLPYSIFLHNPDLAQRKLHVGTYVRFESSLPRNISELTICTAAREMDCKFEWAAHAAAAPREGVSAEAIDVIAHRKALDGLSEDEALPIRFTRELLGKKRVSDATYRAVFDKYGKKGVLDMAGTAGYYIMSACWMNVMEIEPPPDRPQLPM